MKREEEIFEHALALTSSEARADYLLSACARDDALRRRVEELLAAHQDAGMLEFLKAEERTRKVVPFATGDRLTEKPGDRIGRYKLLEQIGEGGCGVVYVADQEEPVCRRVALKIVKLGMDTRSVVARFEAERQALALMDHPNIAKVFDAGATDTGRPFFVMELVRGVRITEYCDQNNLSTSERLGLFIQVCHAIQHAHQKGIIHRDIKPSNILVTLHDGVAVPKVIDFGIAKATTQQRLTDKTIYTAFEQFIGTPAYMSPEQAEMSGLDVDTRSDIYALGVLLYELLTGKTPFDAKTLLAAGLDEMRRIIREQEPLRPSTRLGAMVEGELTTTAKHRRAAAPKLIHLLHGDLDWIIMRALEKDRRRRYETANGLAEDIERHLNHELVTARPPSAAYRAQKFVRRNKLVVTAGMAVAAALLLGVMISTWQAVRASQQRARAEANARKAVQTQQLAQANELLARQNAYAADMKVADTAWRGNYLGQALTALRQHIPKPGETDLRGIEWRYLWHKCQSQQSKSFPHDAEVTCARLSPDGRWLATESGGAFWVWDTTREGAGRMLSSGAPRDIGLGVGEHLAFDPQGRFLATGATSEVLIWSIADWRKLQSLPTTEGNPCFSGDGTTLATFGGEGVQVWKVATWEPLVRPGQIKVGWANCRRVALNRDGSLLAIGWQNTWRSENSAVGDVTLWKVPECRLLSKWSEVKDAVAVAFSDDDRWLAACTMGPPSMVWLWSVGAAMSSPAFQRSEAEPPAQRLACPRLGRALAFAPGGDVLATAGSDHVIRLWDTGHANQSPRLLQGHLNEVFSLNFSTDGQLLSASGDKTVGLWNIREAQSRPSAFSIPPGRLVGAQTAAAQRILTVNLTNLTFEEWDMESGECLREKSIQRAGAILHNGLLYSGKPLQDALLVNNYVSENEVTNGVPWMKTLYPLPSSSGASAWDLFATTGDGRFYAWNAQSGELVYSNKVAPTLLVAYPLADHGKLVLVEGENGALSLYDLENHQRERIEEHVPRMPPAWKASPNGRFFSYFMTNDQVRVYDSAVKQVRFTLKLPEPPVHVVTAEFSPDSRWLAVGTWGGRVQVWDVGTGRPVSDPMTRYSADSWKFSFSADSKSLVIYCMDYTARIWDVATGREMLSGLPSNGFLNFHLNWMLLPPDGNSVVEGAGEQALRVVRLPTLAEIDAIEKKRIGAH